MAQLQVETSRALLRNEITIIAAMFEEIFPDSICTKLKTVDGAHTYERPPISYLLACVRDHIKASYFALHGLSIYANTPQEDSLLLPLELDVQSKALASENCSIIQLRAEENTASLQYAGDAHVDWMPLVWKAFVLSNLIELFFSDKMGPDPDDAAIEEYQNASLRFMAKDLVCALKSLQISDTPPLQTSYAGCRKPINNGIPLCLYPLTQKLWDKVRNLPGKDVVA